MMDPMPEEDRTGQTPHRGGGRRGRGAHSQNISTRRSEIPHRPMDAGGFEHGGVKYFSYNQAPVRQDRLQALCEPKLLSLRGYVSTTNDFLKVDSVSSVRSAVPAFRQSDIIWSQSYELLRELAQDRDQYRHLPGELNSDDSMYVYIMTYLYARAILSELTSWQWLSQYDHAHMAAGIQARKVSRGRLDGLWEDLSAFNMFPGFVGLIDRISKPILGTASEVVYHPAFPVPHGLVAALGVSVLRFPYSIPNRAGLTLPDVAARYTNMATTVENLVLSLQRLATGMSSDLKSDFRNIESIMDMLGIPQPTPVKWSSYQPTIQSQVILDVLTRRGMWVGADDVTGTDKYLMFPWLDDMSGMVEVRGYGDAPPDDVFIGGLGPLSVLSDKADTDISSTLYLLGICGYGVSAHATVASGSEVSKHRAIAGFSQEDGWAQVSSSYALNSNIQRSPLRNHQYSYAGQLSSTATVDMRVNDTVGYSGYVPVEDVGYHFLAWLSQTMNLPFLSG